MSNPKPPKKSVTASELMAQLQQDPQYQVRMQQTEAQRQESIQRHRLAAEPVVQDLRNAGFDVENIDELRRSGIDYEAAIPLLLKWLPLIAESAVKDSIVRALSVPWARQAAARPLIGQFHAAPDTAADLKWTIGNALAVVADDDVFNEIAELARDKRNGKSREMLAVALGNMRNPAAVDVLIKLLEDDEVAGHALMGLAKLKAHRARPYIERFLKHPKAWVRKEASKALAKLNK
jgi:HEAT repeat protein